MAKEILMQRLNESMEEGKIIKWLKKVGDYVEKGSPLVEIETTKAVVEVESPESGYLIDILAKEGDNVAIGTVICVLGEKNEKYQPSQKREYSISNAKEEGNPNFFNDQKEKSMVNTNTFTTSDRILISPYARKLAKDNNINISDLVAWRPGKKLVAEDITEYLEYQNKQKVLSDSITGLGSKKIIYSSRRKIIAKTMQKSRQEKPSFVLNIEVFASELLKLKKQYSDVFNKKLSITAIIAKAATCALMKNPIMNSHVQEDSIEIFEDINLGIAVADENGLVVPVIHKAQKLSIYEITTKIEELTKKVHENRLDQTDVQGGTFTISNLGMYKISSFTAIINPPECGILAVSAINERFCKIEQEGRFVPTMTLTLTADHRGVDGDVGAKFLGDLKQYLEEPILML